MQAELLAGEDIARCPSCSLYLVVDCSPEELEGVRALAGVGGGDLGGGGGAPVLVR